jgi:hypothetical protein
LDRLITACGLTVGVDTDEIRIYKQMTEGNLRAEYVTENRIQYATSNREVDVSNSRIDTSYWVVVSRANLWPAGHDLPRSYVPRPDSSRLSAEDTVDCREQLTHQLIGPSLPRSHLYSGTEPRTPESGSLQCCKRICAW